MSQVCGFDQVKLNLYFIFVRIDDGLFRILFFDIEDLFSCKYLNLFVFLCESQMSCTT